MDDDKKTSKFTAIAPDYDRIGDDKGKGGSSSVSVVAGDASKVHF